MIVLLDSTLSKQRVCRQAGAGKGKSVGTLLLLDVEMEAPVITMPRCSDSRDALEVDLGHLQLRNALSWRGGAGAGDKKVGIVRVRT